jgi:AraC-like DNA-binding protein
MDIFYLEEHLSCTDYTYVSDYNIGFKYENVAEGESIVPAGTNYNCLIFLVKGNANIFYESKEHILKKGNLCFIPLSTYYKIQAITDISVIINYFNRPIDLCEKLLLENLDSFIERKKNQDYTLRINLPMKRFLFSLIGYLNKGISCKHFHEIKQKELFFIFRFFYTKREIAGLLAPLISQNLDFKSLVLSNYPNVNSVKDLARVCNCSLSSFSRSFKANFKENPYLWLQNQKLRHITGKLSDKTIPLSRIIDEFGFSSPSHFTIFCKKHLNLTPTQFRRQHAKVNI